MTRAASGPATVADFTRATGVNIDERDVVAALEELRQQGWLSDAEPALTTDEARFLDAYGGVDDNRRALLKARVASRARTEMLVRDGMTVEQVADLLQISTSRVRHRLTDGTLYSYPSHGRGVPRVIPGWQFSERVPTPHLATVLSALPADFTRTEVRDFALNAEIDHPARDAVVPLLQWLRDGGAPGPAVELARAQAEML